MSKSNTTEDALLSILYLGVGWANVFDNAASSPMTTVAVVLMTAAPGEGGTMTTNVVAYTNYAPVAVARSGSGWTVSNGVVTPVATITFPQGGAGASPIAAYFAAGIAGGAYFHSGPITPNIQCGNLITPQLVATSIAED